MLTNRLGAEQSPYLLQHRHNPVAWQPWDETAFEAARSLDRPVFLSIGYSTCHWCHVMERESFESAEVAELLNRAFVPIKVDREERPDVDAIYMEATQALTGHGGWPMSVWLTPDRAPFFCGTYFPPERFVLVLTRIAEIWRDQRQDLLTQAETVLEALRRAGERPPRATIDDRPLALLLSHWEQRFDRLHGGFRGAPKFPQAAQLRALLRIARRGGTTRPLTLVRTTLDGMCRGGIYDHLGGGFARYSVDEAWSVPHFEKMLYDQASLADAYLESWQFSGLTEDALVVRETLDYLLRELRDPCGAFHAAEDADSEGEEGRYYVWTESELRSLAGERFDLLAAALGVSRQGNFEHGTNILALQPGHDRTTRSAELRGLIEELRQVRDQRIHPHRDDKILTDWNGLAIGALARAARALPDARYLAAARIAAEFVWQELRTARGTLRHRWRAGEAAIDGFVDDYAFMIEALIELHQADLDPRWLERAVQLQELQDQLFFDRSRGDYRFATGSDPLVPVVRYESFDGVVPAGRSVSALNLQRLALLTGKQAWAEQADRLFAATPDVLTAAPAAFAQLLLALDFREGGGCEVSIEGPDRDRSIAPFLAQLRRGFQPALLVRHAPGESAPRARVCEPGVCLPWTDDPAEAARQAQRFRPLVIEG